jgi:hypothetical protein
MSDHLGFSSDLIEQPLKGCWCKHLSGESKTNGLSTKRFDMRWSHFAFREGGGILKVRSYALTNHVSTTVRERATSTELPTSL